MRVEDGVVITEDSDEILNAMIDTAEEYFETEFSDSEVSVIKTFYEPIADYLANIQEGSSEILESVQLENAQGAALDFLCALIGVSRLEAENAEGEVRFYRNKPSQTRDYTIPSGTIIRTSGDEPISFRTTQSAVLEEGNTEVSVPIEAEDPGFGSNVSSNTITVIVNNIAGVDGVNNDSPVEGGQDEESDNNLRTRAQKDLAQGSSSTANAILTAIGQLDDVNNVRIFKNENQEFGDMPGFELVVQGGIDEDVAETIADKIAIGDTPYGGNVGNLVSVEVELENGQDWQIEFSRPEEVEIYIDGTIEVKDSYTGTDNVIDSIIDYTGGTNTNGNIINGEISIGDDVVYGEIKYAIRSVQGVYDISDLTIGTDVDPIGESNISIEDFELATISDTSQIDITYQEI